MHVVRSLHTVECEFNGDELTTRFVLSNFRRPDRHNRIEDTGTPTVDQSCADHPGVVHGRSLQASANDGNQGTEKNALDATVPVTKGPADQAAYEGSKIVDRDDAALEKRIDDDRLAVGALMTEAHTSVVVVGSVDTAHHALIITKEED